mgnify:CR=1 FL=1
MFWPKTTTLTTAILFCQLLLFSQNSTLDSTHQKRLHKDLTFLTQLESPRNYKNIASLNKVANYIKDELTRVCDSVAFQSYPVKGKEYKNVIGSIGLHHKERIVIGAHYDVYGNSQGADDNASGVSAMLYLAKRLKDNASTKGNNYLFIGFSGDIFDFIF